MPPQATAPTLEIREVQLRAETESGKREFTGIAVPWDDPVTIRGWFQTYTEQFERGAVEDSEDAKVFWRHDEPIGRLTRAEDTDAGWEITGVLSATPRGDEAYTLLRDGVIDRMSVGFEPIEHRETELEDGTVQITRTRVKVREVSLVPFPAYDGATVDQVRHDQPHERNAAMPPETITATLTPEQVRDWNEKFEDITRRLDSFGTKLDERDDDRAPIIVQHRSAGALLKAIAAGDEDALREYNEIQARAWDPAGTTTENVVTKDGWVGDLTRFVEEKATLRSLFSTGTLPAEGNNIEYAQLKADTTQVDEQAAEGNDLAFGKVELETKTAPVKTYGGYTRLSLQSIQRSSVAVVDAHLRALDLAANKRRNIAFRAHYAAAVTAQRTANNVVDVPATGATYIDWVGAIVDAAEKYEDLGLDLDGMTVDKTGFKELAGLTASDGRPLLTVHGSGTNVVGELDPKAIQGVLAGVLVRLNPKQTTAGASFYNRLAIRAYTSPLGRLQDDNVINLSRDFSVYYYEAIANEIPAAIVPVRRTTSGG